MRHDGAFYTQLIIKSPTVQLGTKRGHNLPANYILLAKGVGDDEDSVSNKTIILEKKEEASAAVSGAALLEVRVY